MNARHIKHVPGHKTDKNDSEWICQLLMAGLLKPSFIPPVRQRVLRDLTRYRYKLIQVVSANKNRIIRTLEDGNVRLSSVLSDTSSTTTYLCLHILKTHNMETKEYFEKVMQDYTQHRNGRSLRKYCKDEAVDYDWLLGFKKNYLAPDRQRTVSSNAGFIPLLVAEDRPAFKKWEVEKLLLKSPDGGPIEIKSSNLFVVAELLHKMS